MNIELQRVGHLVYTYTFFFYESFFTLCNVSLHKFHVTDVTLCVTIPISIQNPTKLGPYSRSADATRRNGFFALIFGVVVHMYPQKLLPK